MEYIKFAIIGCGRIAERHVEQINKIGCLKAVCDIDNERLNVFKNKYNVVAYKNIDDLLHLEKDIDVMSICTPNGLHALHTIKALKAGFHVLCEKPMALSVHDCGEMIKEAERANKRLFIVKQNRFNPPVVEVKKVIEEGHLGKVLSFQLNCYWNRDINYYTNSSWKGKLALDGGILYTQFSHFIDLVYYILGDVKKVKAYAQNYVHKDIIEFDDTIVAIAQLHNGIIGCMNFTINSYEKNMEGSLTIFGSKGTVKIGGQYLNTIEYQKIENLIIKDLPIGNKSNEYGTYQGSMSNHDLVYKNVVDVLSNNGIISTNGYEGLKTVEIIDKLLNELS